MAARLYVASIMMMVMRSWGVPETVAHHLRRAARDLTTTPHLTPVLASISPTDLTIDTGKLPMAEQADAF
jgi:hypothetical protein